MLARIEAEKENPQADIDWGAINFNFYKQHPDLWESYVSPNEANLDENYRNNTDGNVTYCNLSGSGCFILNNTLLKELGVEVKGYADLLQPELKGKIAMGDPTASSSAFAELTNMLLDMGEGDTPADRYMSDAAWDYIAKFIDNIDGIVLSSSSQVYKNVIAGEYAVGVSYEDPVVQAIIDNKDNPRRRPVAGVPRRGCRVAARRCRHREERPQHGQRQAVRRLCAERGSPDCPVQDHHPRHHDLHRTGLPRR